MEPTRGFEPRTPALREHESAGQTGYLHYFQAQSRRVPRVSETPRDTQKQSDKRTDTAHGEEVVGTKRFEWHAKDIRPGGGDAAIAKGSAA